MMNSCWRVLTKGCKITLIIDEGVFVKINSCGQNLRILRVAASSNKALNWTAHKLRLWVHFALGALAAGYLMRWA